MALTNKITNIANAIRTKTNTIEPMTLDEMATNIENIKTEPNLQDKSMEITENGTITVTPDEGHDGLNSVTITTNIEPSGGKIAPIGINFENYKGTEIPGLDIIDTSNINSGVYMFMGCTNLTKLNLTYWNVSNMKSFMYMFRGCTSLTELHIENWNTSNVTTMDSLLFECNNLKSIDLNNWDVSNTTNLCRVFYGCKALTELDLSNWVTTSATSMIGMFDYCTSLRRLDIRNFMISASVNINEMFRYTKADCLIIVKDDDTKALITSKFSRLTNVKTVAELG